MGGGSGAAGIDFFFVIFSSLLVVSDTLEGYRGKFGKSARAGNV
jgi:hypothetical protein